MSAANEQPAALLGMLSLLNASHVNLVAASDQASVLHARMFQAAVGVLGGLRVVLTERVEVVAVMRFCFSGRIHGAVWWFIYRHHQ